MFRELVNRVGGTEKAYVAEDGFAAHLLAEHIRRYDGVVSATPRVDCPAHDWQRWAPGCSVCEEEYWENRRHEVM